MHSARRPRPADFLQAMLVVMLVLSLTSCTGKAKPTAAVNPNLNLDLNGDPTIWYVATNGDDQASTCHHPASPCRTIQSVIGRAADGDTIHIADGVYSERLDMGSRELTIEGAGPSTILENPIGVGGQRPASGGV